MMNIKRSNLEIEAQTLQKFRHSRFKVSTVLSIDDRIDSPFIIWISKSCATKNHVLYLKAGIEDNMQTHHIFKHTFTSFEMESGLYIPYVRVPSK